MSTTLDDAAFDNPDAPEGYKSAPAKTQYLIAVSVASVVFLIAQFLLPQVVSLYMMPGMMAGGGMFQMDIPEVHKATVWQDQIWMPVTRVAAGPGPQTMLKATTVSGEWVEKSELTLPFTPEFLLADGGRLWCVANGQVAIVEGRNFSASYPALKLNAPSNPYLHAGQLRIVDRDAQGVWRVLEFRDGEWATIGRVTLPRNITPLPPNAPNVAIGVIQNSQELTVIPGDNGPQALFSDGVARWFAESLPLMSDDVATEPDDAVSALEALQLGPDPWQSCEPMAEVRPIHLNGRLALVEVSGHEMSQTLTAYWFEDGKLEDFGTMPITLSEHHGVVTKNDRVYVLTDSFPPGEVRVTELTAEGFPATQGGKTKSLFTGVVGEFAKLYAVLFAIPFVLLAIYVPVLHVAMRACRNPSYGFAHQTVRLASIGRRAVARGVDTLIFLAPMAAFAAWLYLTFDLEQMVQQMSNDPVSMLTSIGVTVLAFLTYIVLVIVVFGVMEGVLGWSPGKLLCGLRVVRTTLQPVGVLRGIVRHFLLVVDGQFNYLVGGAMVAVLARQQRLGDLAADSIVVEAASLQESRDLTPRGELS